MYDDSNLIWIWSLMTGLIYLFWDITTLGLYVYKIRSFRNEPIIYKPVLSLLYRILILTLFYEIILFISVVIIAILIISSSISRAVTNSFTALLFNLSIVSVSYSMHLMMDHNLKQYDKFLRVIYYFRFHHLFCKYKYIVTDQLNEADVDIQALSLEITSISSIKKRENKSYECTTTTTTISHNDETCTRSPNSHECELSIVSSDNVQVTTPIE